MTTRSKKKSGANVTPPSPLKKRVENSWILLAKGLVIFQHNIHKFINSVYTKISYSLQIHY